MNQHPHPAPGQGLCAEFDLLADEYYEQHQANVAVTGERPEYFAEYKIADLARLVQANGFPCERILDFGSGIGNSVPFFRKYFGGSHLSCADISRRSIEVAQARFPGKERHLDVSKGIPLPAASQDIVFSACVFHHIPHDEHQRWLTELRRITRRGGLLVIYEHNPLNPLTVRAVNTCPLDVNARLLRGGTLRQTALISGWDDAQVAYKLFFPAQLKLLRPLEHHLRWLPLGAQYRVTARTLA